VKRRIDTATSRTAQMTCLSRACSALEKNPCYRTEDDIAPLLLPGGLKPFIHFKPVRNIFTKMAAPKGIYEYVIARTKYIDAVFKDALKESFDQILIFGAGFDTRALRFRDILGDTVVFELDVPVTQQAKIGQYRKRHLTVPLNLKFIAIDFDQECLPTKLDAAGFLKQARTLFILEGLIMYLQPESVHATFQIIRDYAGDGSRVAFDYVYASVLRREGTHFGEASIVRKVSRAGEQWHFGIEEGRIASFLSKYGLRLMNHKDSEALEKTYFSDRPGHVIGRVNSTHCLVTAEKGSS